MKCQISANCAELSSKGRPESTPTSRRRLRVSRPRSRDVPTELGERKIPASFAAVSGSSAVRYSSFRFFVLQKVFDPGAVYVIHKGLPPNK